MDEPPAKRMCLAFNDKECRAMIKHMGTSLYPLFAYLGNHTILEKKKEKWEAVVEAVNEVSKVKRSRRDVWQEFVRLSKEVHKKNVVIRREERKLDTAMSTGKDYDTSRMLKLSKVEQEFEHLMDWAVSEGMGRCFDRAGLPPTTNPHYNALYRFLNEETTLPDTDARSNAALFTPPLADTTTTTTTTTSTPPPEQATSPTVNKEEEDLYFMKKEQDWDESEPIDFSTGTPSDTKISCHSVQDGGGGGGGEGEGEGGGGGGGGEVDVKEEAKDITENAAPEDTNDDSNTPAVGSVAPDSNTSCQSVQDTGGGGGGEEEGGGEEGRGVTVKEEVTSTTEDANTNTAAVESVPLDSNTSYQNEQDTREGGGGGGGEGEGGINISEETKNTTEDANTNTTAVESVPLDSNTSSQNAQDTREGGGGEGGINISEEIKNTTENAITKPPPLGMSVEGLGVLIEEELNVVKDIMNEMCQSLQNIEKLASVIAVTLTKLTASRTIKR